MSLFDCSMRFARTYGQLELGQFRPDGDALPWIELREVESNDTVRATIRIKSEELDRLIHELTQWRYKTLGHPSNEKKVDPVLVGRGKK